jgi:transketolase
LAKDGIKAAVVSMPSFELFRSQSEDYQHEVLGKAPRVAVEAGIAQCWYEWLRKSDVFIGMHGFGASAPAGELYRHFGITAASAVEAARRVIAKS